MSKYENLYSQTATSIKASAIRELLKIIAQPDIISFAGGLPDPTLFPSQKIAQILRDVVIENPKETLQYGTTEGQKGFKEELIQYLKESEDIDAFVDFSTLSEVVNIKSNKVGDFEREKFYSAFKVLLSMKGSVESFTVCWRA